jgi:hypothetical protein
MEKIAERMKVPKQLRHSDLRPEVAIFKPEMPRVVGLEAIR